MPTGHVSLPASGPDVEAAFSACFSLHCTPMEHMHTNLLYRICFLLLVTYHHIDPPRVSLYYMASVPSESWLSSEESEVEDLGLLMTRENP